MPAAALEFGARTGSDAVLWKNTRGNSYTPSPVLYDNKLYTLTDTGMLSCYNARSGVPVSASHIRVVLSAG